MKTTVSLAAYNGLKWLPQCLKSLKQQAFQDFELIIVDNGSTDGTLEFLRNYQEAPFTLIANKKNLGFAAGHNLAISKARGEYILVLNQDIILEPDYLSVLVDFLDQHHRAGSASGKLLRLDENGQKTNIIDCAGLKIFKSQRVVERGAGESDGGQYDKTEEVFGQSAAAAVYRKKTLEETALPRPPLLSSQGTREYFDEDFFAYKEDVDLAYRLRWAGREAWVAPSAMAYHARGVKSQQVFKKRKKRSFQEKQWSYRNHLFVLIKNLSIYHFFRYFPRIFAYEAGKFFYLLFFEPKTLAGGADFFEKLSIMLLKRKHIADNKKIKTKNLNKFFGQ